MVKISTVLFAVAATVPAHVSANNEEGNMARMAKKLPTVAEATKTVSDAAKNIDTTAVTGAISSSYNKMEKAIQGCMPTVLSCAKKVYDATPECATLIPKAKFDSAMRALSRAAKKYPNTAFGGKVVGGVAGAAGVACAGNNAVKHYFRGSEVNEESAAVPQDQQQAVETEVNQQPVETKQVQQSDDEEGSATVGDEEVDGMVDTDKPTGTQEEVEGKGEGKGCCACMSRAG